MENTPSTRSVKISADERGGWSSERPRRDGVTRPPDISVRSRVLTPSDRLRYSPGSLVLIVSGSAADRDRFAERVIASPNSLFSLDKVRDLLAGRVGDDEVEERAPELLDAAVMRRLEAGDTVVIAAEGLDAAEREHYVRMAHGFKRPRHLILLETARDQVADEERSTLNDLRRRLDAGELGAEGFQTVLRLSAGAASEVGRVVFQPAPRDD